MPVKKGGNQSAEKGTSEILGHKQFTFEVSLSFRTDFIHKYVVIVEQNNFSLISVIF